MCQASREVMLGIGGVRTLRDHAGSGRDPLLPVPATEQRAALGIPDGFLRLSCGIEDAEDIIADLSEALGRG